MAGGAPKLCVSGVHLIGGGSEQEESDSDAGDNTAGNASHNATGPAERNGSGNAQTPANGAAPSE
jgi:hypothetical protein